MWEGMMGFLIWAAVGCLIIAFGISAFKAKKEFGFWANVRTLPMKDVKAYNRAVGRLFIVYGIVFILLGLPFLAGEGSLWIVVSMLGAMGETIAAMAIYTIVIQAKYEKK